MRVGLGDDELVFAAAAALVAFSDPR